MVIDMSFPPPGIGEIRSSSSPSPSFKYINGRRIPIPGKADGAVIQIETAFKTNNSLGNNPLENLAYPPRSNPWLTENLRKQTKPKSKSQDQTSGDNQGMSIQRAKRTDSMQIQREGSEKAKRNESQKANREDLKALKREVSTKAKDGSSSGHPPKSDDTKDSGLAPKVASSRIQRIGDADTSQDASPNQATGFRAGPKQVSAAGYPPATGLEIEEESDALDNPPKSPTKHGFTEDLSGLFHVNSISSVASNFKGKILPVKK